MKTISSHSARRNRRRSAFTFTEVLVAAGILGTAFVGIFGSMTMGFSVTEMSRENMRATQIMLDKMEGVRLYNWTQLNDPTFLQSSFTNWFYETSNIGLSNAVGSGVQYYGQVSVATCAFGTAYNANMRQVTVSVTWTNDGASSAIVHTRSMTTLVSLPGMQNYVYND